MEYSLIIVLVILGTASFLFVTGWIRSDTIVAIRRRGKPVLLDHGDVVLEFGDVLLVNGVWQDILNLRNETKEFVLLTFPEEFEGFVPASDKSKIALGILMLMALVMAFNI